MLPQSLPKQIRRRCRRKKIRQRGRNKKDFPFKHQADAKNQGLKRILCASSVVGGEMARPASRRWLLDRASMSVLSRSQIRLAQAKQRNK